MKRRYGWMANAMLAAAVCGAIGRAAPQARADISPPSFDGGPGTGPVDTGEGASNVRPRIFDQVGIDQHLNGQLPLDLKFQDEYGRTVKLGDYVGKRPIILTFVQYNCPMLCTIVLNDLCRTINALPLKAGQDYDLLTISFDPREQSNLAAKKKAIYLSQLAQQNLDGAWHFLCGSQDSINRATQAAGFRYVYDAKLDQFIHPSGIMVLTSDGRFSKYFYGLEYSTRDLQLALNEANQSEIGSLSEAILIPCFHYNPTTGRYDLAVANLLKVAGGLTVLCLGGFVAIQFRKGPPMVKDPPETSDGGNASA